MSSLRLTSLLESSPPVLSEKLKCNYKEEWKKMENTHIILNTILMFESICIAMVTGWECFPIIQ